ncbi:MAG: DUF1015 domain-containing protein [Actinomycetota bacterium]|nr:DUF1015 domain-containing protein [Actinomycetota bacterium]
MVDVAPFRGLFFNEEKAGKISKAISPPYDVIPAALENNLHNYSKYNIINLTLPEGKIPLRYKRARELLNDWVNKKILKFDNDKCFYVFMENFPLDGKIRKIFGFIGLTRLEPYSRSEIMPHEKTSSKVKRDRLGLLSECRTNFGPVFTIYNDSNHKIKNILEIKMKEEPIVNLKPNYDPSLNFKLWKVSDTENIDKITGIMKENKLIIADGHHRYETSLKYKNIHERHLKNNKEKKKSYPEDFVLTLYIDSSQNDFLILPTYRMIKFHNYPGIEEFINKISYTFDIEEKSHKSASYINEKLSTSKSKGLKSFFLYGMENKIYFITLKPIYMKNITYRKKGKINYSTMDVNILQKFLTEYISNWYKIKKISYSCSTGEVLNNINRRKYDVGIFLNAPTANELEKICESGYLMPEKSTYFHPKPCSGLVMYKFDR